MKTLTQQDTWLKPSYVREIRPFEILEVADWPQKALHKIYKRGR